MHVARVADIDLGRAQIFVRSGKGDKDRVVMLPQRLQEPLAAQLDAVERRWRLKRDAAGCQRVPRASYPLPREPASAASGDGWEAAIGEIGIAFAAPDGHE